MRVLIIESNDRPASPLGELLAAKDHSWKREENPYAALACVTRSDACDLLIIDLRHTGATDGILFAQRIASLRPSLPVLLLERDEYATALGSVEKRTCYHLDPFRSGDLETLLHELEVPTPAAV